MTLVNRAALFCDDISPTWLHLHPYGPLDITERPLTSVDHRLVPHFAAGSAGMANVYNHQHGWVIDVNGRYVFATPAEGLVWEDSLRNHMRNSSTGAARDVEILAWLDDAGSIKRVFRSCRLSSDPVFTRNAMNSKRIADYSFQLTSMNPTRYAVATDTSTPTAGDFESILYTTASSGAAPVGTTISITIIHNSRIVVTFDHLVDAVASANTVHFTQRKIWFNATTAVTCKNFQIIGCNSEGDATTTIRSSTTDYSSAGTSQDVSVAASASVSASVNTGSVPIAANGYLYTYITAAGNHQGPQLMFEVELS